jgi:hypothetical protein
MQVTILNASEELFHHQAIEYILYGKNVSLRI